MNMSQSKKCDLFGRLFKNFLPQHEQISCIRAKRLIFRRMAHFLMEILFLQLSVFRSQEGKMRATRLEVHFFETLDPKTAKNSKMRGEAGAFSQRVGPARRWLRAGSPGFHDFLRIHPDEKRPAGSFCRASIRVCSGPWAVQKHHPLAMNEPQRTQGTQKGGAGPGTLAGGSVRSDPRLGWNRE
jgi:hypothetical protein